MRIFQYLLAFVIIGVSWAVVTLLGLPPMIGMAITGVVSIGLAGLVTWQRERDKRSGQKLENKLIEQGDEAASLESPENQQQIRRVEKAFADALSALKAAHGRGQAALYRLPWYMLIGPPGTGKTTALRGTRLRLDDASTLENPVDGFGGTTDCKWWISRHGVLLDTVGRYNERTGADSSEWLRFLELIRTYRRERPINGLLAVMNIDALIAADAAGGEDFLAAARRIRTQINEITRMLEVIAPVYVLFTKCDLVTGFRELFSELKGDDLRQIWGFTYGHQEARAPTAQQFLEHYDELIAVAERRALGRIGTDERNFKRNARIFRFAPEMRTLRTRLARFIEELFAESQLHATPPMRGVYFTSGTQEGRPLELTLNRLFETSEGLQDIGPRSELQRPGEGKSFFVGDIFSEVIFPDRHMVVNTPRQKRRKLVRRVAMLGAASVLTTGFSYYTYLAYAENRAFVDQVRSASRGLKRASQPVLKAEVEDKTKQVSRVVDFPKGRLPHLATLNRTLEELGVVESTRTYESRSFAGFARPEELAASIKPFYRRAVHEYIFTPAFDNEEELLRETVRTYGRSSRALGPKEQELVLDAFRFYLLVTWEGVEKETRDNATPNLMDRVEEVSGHVAKVWRSRITKEASSPGEDVEAGLKRIQSMVRDTLPGVAKKTRYRKQRDEALAKQVRAILERRNGEDPCTVGQLIRELGDQTETLAGFIGSSTGLISRGNEAVRRVFTRDMYNESVRERLLDPNRCADSSWPLTRKFALTPEKRREKLREQYFHEYEREWTEFIDSVAVDVDNRNNVRSALTKLTRPPDPFQRLADVVRRNTQLTEPPRDDESEGEGPGLGTMLMGEAKASGDKLGSRSDALTHLEAELARKFRGFIEFAPPADESGDARPDASPAAVYQGILKGVLGKLSSLEFEGDKRAIHSTFDQARIETQALIDERDVTWRPMFVRLLTPPLVSSLDIVADQLGDTIQHKWCNEVADRYHRKIASMYPFNPKTTAQVVMSDFVEFFRPDSGLLWDFYARELSSVVIREDKRFRIIKEGASAVQYTAKLARFLERAHEISDTMFAGQDTPNVPFEVWPLSSKSKKFLVEKIVLTVDDQTTIYQNEKGRWHAMQWPGEGDPRGASLTVLGQGHDGRQDKPIHERPDDWGFFKLLEDGKLRAEDSRTYLYTVKFPENDDLSVQFKIRFRRSDTPFFGFDGSRDTKFLAPFRKLDFPLTIVKGGGGCPGLGM